MLLSNLKTENSIVSLKRKWNEKREQEAKTIKDAQAGIAVVEQLLEKGFLETVVEKGEYFKEQLGKLKDKYNFIKGIVFSRKGILRSFIQNDSLFFWIQCVPLFFVFHFLNLFFFFLNFFDEFLSL